MLGFFQAKLIKKILTFVLFLGVFIAVIFYVEPPKSWPEASIFQILIFFIPLILALTTLIDILVHYIPHSFIFALGAVMGLAFYSVGQLNILSGLLVILITLLSYRIVPKVRLPRLRLTRGSKIPKLHMQKKEKPKLKGELRKLRHV